MSRYIVGVLAQLRRAAGQRGFSMEKKSMKESVFPRNVHVLAQEG